MKQEKSKIYGPDYLLEYNCKMSNCEETCCKDWIVNIDKDTFKLYKNIKDDEFKVILNNCIEKNKFSKRNRIAYGTIKMNEQKYCPLLTNDLLCSLQLKHGESHLSCICNTYPRAYNLLDGNLEKSLNLSCPEAARVALLNENPIKFIKIQEIFTKKNFIKSTLNTRKRVFFKFYKKYFYDFRKFSIDLMQNRKMKMWERLFMMGIFYKMAEELVFSGKFLQIKNLIKSFPEIIRKNLLKENISEISTINVMQIEIMKQLSESISTRKSVKDYVECYEQLLVGIGYTEKAPIEEVVKNYDEAYKNYYEPFMSKNEHILENYIVNYIFKSLFPLTGIYSLFDSYILLIIHYSLIKLHLIGIAAYNKGLTKELIIKLIYSFSKTFEHNEKFFMEALLVLRKNGFSNLATMAIFIKN